MTNKNNTESPSTMVEGDSNPNQIQSQEEFFAIMQKNFPISTKKAKRKKVNKIADKLEQKLDEFHKNHTWVSIHMGTGYWVKNEDICEEE